MDVVSLIIAILALLASLTSLTWQFISWRWSGPRVKVTSSFGMAGWGLQTDLVIITAANSGRQATIVHGFGFRTPDGRTLVELQSFAIPVQLPAQLPIGGEASFYFDPTRLRQTIAREQLLTASLVPFARTGHGTMYGAPRTGRDS